MSTAGGTATFDQFATIFTSEHRTVRDLLLDLIHALQAHDLAAAEALLSGIAAVTGPHFRYEEEALYPALTAIFGDNYVEKLLADHDFAIASAARLVKIVHQASLDDADEAEAIRLVRGILPHVSDCDGLTIMVEVLPVSTVESLLETREAALAAGLDLLTWAAGVRARPVPEPV